MIPEPRKLGSKHLNALSDTLPKAIPYRGIQITTGKTGIRTEEVGKHHIFVMFYFKFFFGTSVTKKLKGEQH